MSFGTSFSTQGANPLGAKVPALSTSGLYSAINKPLNPTPQAAALNSAVSKPTPLAPAVKSTKVTETTYHPPTPPAGGQDTGGPQAGLLGKIQGLNTQVSQATNMGYGPNDQIQHDAGGNLIPKANETPAPQPSPTSYPGILSSIVQHSNAGSMAVDKANQNLQALRGEIGQKSADIAGTGADLNFKTGQEAALQRLGAIKESAAQSGVANALTANQQNISGLVSAGQLAQPVQLPYSNQYVNPQTGQSLNGGLLGGGLNDAVQTVVSRVRSGNMTYSDAVSALGGYGQGGLNALQQALGPDFNVAQSNTLSAQQGSIKPALDYATLALNHAKEVLGTLSVPGQTSNIGAISDAANWFSNKSGVGKEATRTKEGALAEARSAIQSVLASVKGGNPTEYRDQSYALLPNNATPADIDAAMNNLTTLGAGKAGIYGNPGQSGSQNQSSNIWSF